MSSPRPVAGALDGAQQQRRAPPRWTRTRARIRPRPRRPYSVPRFAHQLAGGAIDLGGPCRGPRRSCPRASGMTMKSWMSTRRPACAPPPKIWISGSGRRTRPRLRQVRARAAAVRCGRRVQHRHRGCDRGVAAEPRLLRRAVERDQMRRRSRPGRRRPADQQARRSRRSRWRPPWRTSIPPSALPPSRRSTASPEPRGRAGGRDRAACGAAGEAHFHFDGGPAARVPDSPAVHMGDRRV